MDKYYVSYRHVHNLIKAQSDAIRAAQFEPDYIIAIGGGGLVPARILRTFLNKPIHVLTIGYYKSDQSDEKESRPQIIQWLDESRLDLKNKKILIVDEIDDTRATLAFCLEYLEALKPAEIGVFVLQYKHKDKCCEYPDYIKHIFIGEEIQDKWVVYPWDAEDINEHEKLAVETGSFA